MKPSPGIEPATLEQEARRIIRLLRDEFRLPDGGFSIDKVGSRLMPQHIFHDLGDFVPFLLYFGEHELVDSQVRLFMRAAPGGILVSEYPTARVFYGLAKSYEYTDLLLGLSAFRAETPTQDTDRVVRSTADAAVRIFNLDGKPRSFFWAGLGIRLPVVDTRVSTLIECFLELHRTFDDARYMRVAKNLFRTLTGLPFFRTYGIFPDFALAGLWSRASLHGRAWQSGVMHKSNTNTLFAFLELYRVTGDAEIMSAIRRTVDALKKRMVTKGGGIGERFDPSEPPQRAHLGASFSMIDFLCDLYVEGKHEDDIAFARAIADYWLLLQAPTGLFPVKDDSEMTFVDSETDMIVALHKLFEVTGDEKYLIAAERCFAGVLTYHGAKDYPVSVHIKTGEVIDPTQRTKFLCLFLKVIILRLEMAKGKQIYTDASLFELLKDR